MKRWIAILMVGLAGLLAACGPSSSSPTFPVESLSPVESLPPVESLAPVESAPAVSMEPSASASPSTAP